MLNVVVPPCVAAEPDDPFVVPDAVHLVPAAPMLDTVMVPEPPSMSLVISFRSHVKPVPPDAPPLDAVPLVTTMPQPEPPPPPT